MDATSYRQLRAYAAQYGAIVGLIWIVSFAFYIVGLTHPLIGNIGLLIGIFSVVAAGFLVRKFRHEISPLRFAQSWWMSILIYMYASLLMALAQYIYFAYIDGGYIVQAYSAIMSTPEATAMLKAYGMSGQQLQESINLLAQTEPIYIVLNILSMNVTCGIILSLPVAAIMKRSATNGSNQHPTNS